MRYTAYAPVARAGWDLYLWWAGDARRRWSVYGVVNDPGYPLDTLVSYLLTAPRAAGRRGVLGSAESARHDVKRARFLAANPLAGIQVRYADPLLTIVTDVPWTEARCKAVTCACAQLGAGFSMTMADRNPSAIFRITGRSDWGSWGSLCARALTFIVSPVAPLGWQVSE